MRQDVIAQSIQELARQYDIPFEPDDASLKWRGSPATARSQGSWDPDSQTWASKGKGKERAPESPRTLAKTRLEVLSHALNSKLCQRVPSLLQGNPLAVRHNKQGNVKTEELHMPVGSEMHSRHISSPPPPPPPKVQTESDADSSKDAQTLSEDESTVMLESSETSLYIEVEADTSELPRATQTVSPSERKHIDTEERLRQQEHAIQEANTAALKVHHALSQAALHCRVEELGRRMEQETELRHKAETAKAEAEERLANLHRRLDLERQERATLLDQLHERVRDRPMKDATTRAWTLIETALGIVGQDFVSDESGDWENTSMEGNESRNRKTADAADEAGGARMPSGALLPSSDTSQELDVVQIQTVEWQSIDSHPPLKTQPNDIQEPSSVKNQTVEKHSRYSRPISKKGSKETPEVALVKKQTIEQQSRYSRPLAKKHLKESQELGLVNGQSSEQQPRYSPPLAGRNYVAVNTQIGEQQSRASRALVQSHSKENLGREMRRNAPSSASTARASDDSTCRSRRTSSSPSSSLNAPAACSPSRTIARAPVILAPEAHTPEELLQPFFQTHVRASTSPRIESPCCASTRTSDGSTCRSRRTCSSLLSDRSLNASARAPVIIAPEAHNSEELYQPFFRTHVRASTPPLKESRCCSPTRSLMEIISRSALGSPQRTLVVDGRSLSPQPCLTSPFRAQGRPLGNETCNSRKFGRQALESMRSTSPPPSPLPRHVFQGAFPCAPGRNQGWAAARPCVTRNSL